MHRSISRPKRTILLLLICSLALIFVLPKQSQGLLQKVGAPFAEFVSLPLRGVASVTGWFGGLWDQYIALQQVHRDNQELRREAEFLRGQNNALRETAASSQRLADLLGFKRTQWPHTVPAQVIGRDSTNWYRGLLLNRGEQHGVQPEMGVITPGGMVGRIVKTTAYSSVMLLMTDPNIAVTTLIQRTRDQGIVTGTIDGRVRMKYIPLLSTVRKGDVVITSGLTGRFPKGLLVGVVTQIEKTEDDLFQSAILAPAVDFPKVEEVLVINSSGQTVAATSKSVSKDGASSSIRKPVSP